MVPATRLSQRSVSWLLLVVGVALILAAGSLFVLISTGFVGGGSGSSGPGTVTGFGSVLSAQTPAAPPTVAAPLTTAPLARVIIPAAKVDAPIVTKGVDANGVMQAPDNAYDVAWYGFSARPGSGSNAVFSGHLDYVKVGPAVFWNLKDVKAGDSVQIRYADGTTLNYAVTAVNTFDAATAPIPQIVGPTPKDSLTFITCAGTFNRITRQYDKRLIVRAEKV
ncbi:MAG: class F sortase [Dehalococcoidia bacterium]|nr:class F sortase [Dehalococcoidia bacterium]